MVLRQRSVERLPIRAVFTVDGRLHAHARSGLVRNIGNLQVNVAIEADQPCVFKVRVRDVAEGNGPSSRFWLGNGAAEIPCRSGVAGIPGRSDRPEYVLRA